MENSVHPARWRLSDTAAVWLVGLGFTLLHIAGSGRYGFHRDELLTYSNALHLDWCYEVYPPLTAWIGRLELTLFGSSLVGFRLFAAIAVGVVTVLAGFMARALGGGRRAMLAAAVAVAITGPIFFCGTFLSYMTFDLLWWVVAAWCSANLLRTENPRWWLGIGAAIGMGMLTKYTIVFFAAGLLGGLLLTPNRRWLRSPWFWGGVSVAGFLMLPVILWQMQHHWVGLVWVERIHARDVHWGRTATFLPNQFWRTTNPVTVPLWLGGLWFVFRTQEGKRYRMLGWMYVLTMILLAGAQGRPYYLCPAYPMLLAAGAVWGERLLARLTPAAQRSALRVTQISFAAGALAACAFMIPMEPINSSWWRVANKVNDGFNMEIGWPELVATVARVRDSLPPAERTSLGVMAVDEGDTGAVNLYGRADGLPEAISGMNSNWLRGYGNPGPQTVIAVGFTGRELGQVFESCRFAAMLPRPYGVMNQAIGNRTGVWVCRDVRGGWAAFWKDFQYYG